MIKDAKITIEKLATMVANGFKNTAAKEDLKNLATKIDLEDTERRLSAKIDVVDEKVDALEEVDVRDLHRRVFSLEKDVKQIKHRDV